MCTAKEILITPIECEIGTIGRNGRNRPGVSSRIKPGMFCRGRITIHAQVKALGAVPPGPQAGQRLGLDYSSD